MAFPRIAETFFVACALVLLAAPIYFLLFWRLLPFWRRHQPFWAWLMISGVVGAVLLVIFAVRAYWIPHAVRFPTWARTAGWAVAASAYLIMELAERSITLPVRAFLPVLRPDERFELKTGGVYGVVRHPIYAAMALYGLGIFLAAGYYLVLAALIVWLAVLPWACQREEGVLIERFGDAYREYRARTPMLFPRLVPRRKR
jgi:protein-S-isoprenylcysteine O-methyltransferase Ste14